MTWTRKVAAFLIGCLLLLTPVSFWRAQTENSRIEHEHAAAILRTCQANNQTKTVIAQVLTIAEHLSPPDTPQQVANLRRFQAQVAPLLVPINCRKVGK